MNKRKTNERKTTLRLVVCDRLRNTNQHTEEKMLCSGEGVQLELFPNTSRKLLIIFVRPEEKNLSEIIGGLGANMVSTVIDIREAPFLNFGGIAREFFLDLLEEQKIRYVSLHNWKRSVNLDSIRALLESLEGSAGSSGQKTREALREILLNGTVVVFSDADPRKDDLVKIFESALRKLQLDFSAHYWL